LSIGDVFGRDVSPHEDPGCTVPDAALAGVHDHRARRLVSDSARLPRYAAQARKAPATVGLKRLIRSDTRELGRGLVRSDQQIAAGERDVSAILRSLPHLGDAASRRRANRRALAWDLSFPAGTPLRVLQIAQPAAVDPPWLADPQ